LKSSKKRSPFFAQHVFEVAQDHAAGVFSGTDDVIEKITGHKPMGLEEYIRKHRSAFEWAILFLLHLIKLAGNLILNIHA
jgi:hypothetical protein